jgi:hypothetical protein
MLTEGVAYRFEQDSDFLGADLQVLLYGHILLVITRFRQV